MDNPSFGSTKVSRGRSDSRSRCPHDGRSQLQCHHVANYYLIGLAGSRRTCCVLSIENASADNRANFESSQPPPVVYDVGQFAMGSS